jgi:glycosyltransferase involved in cell wall biosynthesis
MADAVLASILVPVLNEERHLPEVAAQMLAQEADGPLEFLFIDGGSTDRTVEVVERLAREDPRVRLLHNPARHTPAALNLGLVTARGRYVVRMDAHTHYGADYIARGVERLRRGDVAHVSGPQLPRAYDAGSRLVTLALGSRLGVGGAAFRTAQEEIEVDSGFLGVWERERLLELDGWDEGQIRNQDGELAARMRAAGGRIVCIPEMAAWYLPRNSVRGVARQYFHYGRYRARTSLRHPGSVRPAHVLAPGVALTAISALAAPQPLRGLARAGLGVYGATVAAESVRAGGPEAPRLAALFAAMHLSWGFGFLKGLAEFHDVASRSSSAITRPARSMV